MSTAQRNAYQRMWYARKIKNLVWIHDSSHPKGGYLFAPGRDGLHGLSTYSNYGCRCDICASARAQDRSNRQVAA